MNVPNLIVISPDDNVGVVIREAAVGDTLDGSDGRSIKATAEIPKNHKVALVDIPKGDRVVKYGEVIGIATEQIQKGGWIHTHNLRSEEGGS